METLLTSSPSEAASILRSGRLAAFPTETVYGLGADALRPDAVAAIFEAKGRPSDNPLIVHVAARGEVGDVAADVPKAAQALLDRFAPGPLTLILPKRPSIPDVVTAGLGTVGVRIPGHERAQSFLRACETPVAAPSANRSGRPSPTTWEAVQEDLGGRIACILKGGHTEAGVESTVLDCTASPPVVLRPGAVSVQVIEGVIGPVRLDDERESTAAARSPGTRHRHYAPAAQVQVVAEPPDDELTAAGYIGLEAPATPDLYRCLAVPASVEAYAHEVFSFFRACDRAGCSVIYAQQVPEEGLGRALNDRLRRAAAR